MAAKRILSSWSCKKQSGFSALYLHLATDAGGISRLSRLRLISIAGDYGNALLSPQLLPEIIPLLEDPACKVVGHDLLFALGVIRATIGRRLKISNCWDTMIAWQLINNGLPDRGTSLQDVAAAILGRHINDPPASYLPESEWSESERSSRRMEYAFEYVSKASMILEPIYTREKAIIEKCRMSRVADLEFQALPALAEIENCGMGFHTKKAIKLMDRLTGEEDAQEKELKRYAESKGFRAFNPRNPAHVKKMLRILGYDAADTAASTIQKIAGNHPDDKFASMLLGYRETRQQHVLLKSWLDYARDDRIHPSLRALGARGGRVTCFRPNIQQVPRDPKLKSLFEASKGMSLVEADFSAIEMRFVAALSRDENLVKAFKDGIDPHKQTARAIFQKKDISDEERQIAKTLNYGSIYGGGPRMVLGQLPDLNEREAQEFLHRFYAAYPGLKRWQRNASEGATVNVIDGVAYKISRSAMGRIRYIDPQHRNALINNPVQSSAADLLKIALGRLYQKLILPEYSDFRLVNAVHDSILLEVPEGRVKEAAKLLQEVMNHSGDEILREIPCLTEVKAGKDWSLGEEKKGSALVQFLRRLFYIR
jgi:DNA polymerase I